MADGQPWTLKQTGGDQKTLTLSGWSAPFGRPRQKAVVRNGVKVRQKTKRYPGNDQPTRHIFGTEEMPFELSGRFRGRELGGPNGVRAKVQEVKDFVRDCQSVQIIWPDYINVQGFIEEFDSGIESQAEVEWTMRILIDADNFRASSTSSVPSRQTNTTADAEQILQLSTSLTTLPDTPEADAINPDFFDSLDDAISSITGAVGQLVDIANQIQDIESATAAQLRRLEAGIGQAQTAMLTMLQTMQNAQQDSIYLANDGTASLAWVAISTAAQLDAYIALDLLASMSNQAQQADTGSTNTTAQVQDGDTWEKIALRVYGGIDGADLLKRANGVKGGTKPKPGQVLHVPVEK